MQKLIYFLTVGFLVSCFDKPSTEDDDDDDEENETQTSEEGNQSGDCIDGQDNDGDGLIDCADDGCADKPACEETDNDGDGVSLEAGDCDDNDPSIYPGAEEDYTDGIDQDCDGYADVSNAQCNADLTITFADQETVSLDFCTNWSLNSTFEYDPDTPPELNSISLEMNATNDPQFECIITLNQQGICGAGYYRQGLSSGTTMLASMDCTGVSDQNEGETTFLEGYFRIDSINTGTNSGSFVGQPLTTAFSGHLHVWNIGGVDLVGSIEISAEQLAGDEEENACLKLEQSEVDADGDGFVAIEYFDGDDCDDNNILLGSIITDADCDGILTSDDCDDRDSFSTIVAEDGDCDGTLFIDDCDDQDFSSTIVADDADCDGVVTLDDCNDNNSDMPSNDNDCDGTLTPDDCDDTDSNSTTIASDFDCDGILDLFVLPLDNGIEVELALIPSGSDPLGRYTLTNAFYMMTTEVTQGMFSVLMGYDAHTYLAAYGVGPDYPVYYVNWHMSADFANALTAHHNSQNGTLLSECYSCSGSGINVTCNEAITPYQCTGYRLPTEGEWEYAARSGTTSEFWTGAGSSLGGDISTLDELSCNISTAILDGINNHLLSEYAWFCGNTLISSQTVSQKLPNGFGLYDMHGNLWEWTADWWGCQFPLTGSDPYCDLVGTYRVFRGGYWGNTPNLIGASRRYDNLQEEQHYSGGLRIVLSF